MTEDEERKEGRMKGNEEIDGERKREGERGGRTERCVVSSIHPSSITDYPAGGPEGGVYPAILG